MKQLLTVSAVTLLFIFAACQKKNDTPLTTECQTNCALLPKADPCNAYFIRYYFDPVEKKCKEFVWGGCSEVVPFETLEACESCGCK